MFDKLQKAEYRYEEINQELSDPSVISNNDLYRKLMKEHSELEPIVFKYREYKKIIKDIDEARELLDQQLDKDFREMVQEEFNDAKRKLETVQEELRILCFPKILTMNVMLS